MDFWTRLDSLIAAHDVVIDRPRGTAHPRYPSLIYPLDYGYLDGTSGGDGNEIDVWQGSQEPSLLVAVICTVDSLKGDTEAKLLLGCTHKEMAVISRFYNESGSMSGMIVRREESTCA